MLMFLGSALFALVFLLIAPASRAFLVGSVSGGSAWFWSWAPFSFILAAVVLVAPFVSIYLIRTWPEKVEPENPMAAAWTAYWHLFYVGQGWSQNSKKSFETVREHAVRAIRLDPDNAEALGIYAHVCAFADRDFDSALHYYDRAFRLNPNLAIIWALSAPTYCYIGQPEKALRQLDRYKELAPFHPYFFWVENLYTVAYTFLGDYEQAVTVGRRAVKTNPDFVNGYKPLIASLGYLGRRDEAQEYIDKLLSIEPGFTIKRFAAVYPIQKDSDRQRYMEGLRLAGVPEG